MMVILFYQKRIYYRVTTPYFDWFRLIRQNTRQLIFYILLPFFSLSHVLEGEKKERERELIFAECFTL